jgi:hypothetical protein
MPAPIAPMPRTLLDLLQDRHAPAPSAPQSGPRPSTAWAAAALEREAQGVRCAAEGGRNHSLNRAAFALGQLVAGGHLDEEAGRSHLAAAATAAGLGEREIAATIRSGLRAGARSPRHPAAR